MCVATVIEREQVKTRLRSAERRFGGNGEAEIAKTRIGGKRGPVWNWHEEDFRRKNQRNEKNFVGKTDVWFKNMSLGSLALSESALEDPLTCIRGLERLPTYDPNIASED